MAANFLPMYPLPTTLCLADFCLLISNYQITSNEVKSDKNEKTKISHLRTEYLRLKAEAKAKAETQLEPKPKAKKKPKPKSTLNN